MAEKPKPTSEALMVSASPVETSEKIGVGKRALNKANEWWITRPWVTEAGIFVTAVTVVGLGAYGISSISDLVEQMAENPLGKADFMSNMGGGPSEPPVTPVTPVTPEATPERAPPEQPAPKPEDPKPPEVKFNPDDPANPKIGKPNFIPREVEVPDVPKEPEPKFASSDKYETAKLNLGGVDTNGDGVKDGIAEEFSTDNPTQEQIDSFQKSVKDRWGIELTDGQAKMALVDGGFTKDGMTYEIWESKANAGTFYTTEVPKGHDLVGNAINVDTAILTPDETPKIPAELPDADAEGYGRYTETASRDADFVPSENSYAEAIRARDDIFGSEQTMHKAAMQLSGTTPNEIATTPAPPDRPEIRDEWEKMQQYLRSQAGNLPRPDPRGEEILTFLVSRGVIR